MSPTISSPAPLRLDAGALRLRSQVRERRSVLVQVGQSVAMHFVEEQRLQLIVRAPNTIDLVDLSKLPFVLQYSFEFCHSLRFSPSYNLGVGNG